MSFDIYPINIHGYKSIQKKKNADQRLIASQMKKQMIQTINGYRNQTLDKEFQSSKLFKPIIKAQEETKKTIDEKQDKLIEQLQTKPTSFNVRFERYCYVKL